MLLKKKYYGIAALLLLFISLWKPIAVEHTNTAYEYKFGVLFPFLSLRLDELATGDLNVFAIISQAYSYELNILALIVACAVSYLIAYALIRLVVRVFGGARLANKG